MALKHNKNLQTDNSIWDTYRPELHAKHWDDRRKELYGQPIADWRPKQLSVVKDNTQPQTRYEVKLHGDTIQRGFQSEQEAESFAANLDEYLTVKRIDAKSESDTE